MIERIGLDMDGVIYNWYINLKKLMVKEFSLDSRELKHPQEWGVPWMTDEMWDWYYAHPEEIFTLGEAYDNAVWGSMRLQDMTGNLSILTTARPGAEALKEKWLEAWSVDYDELIVGDLDWNKSEQECNLYIDDGLHNLEQIREEHPNADLILMDRPWNRHSDEFVRARGWQDLVQKVWDIHWDTYPKDFAV